MSAKRQRGTAVIMAMLIVAAAATLVSGALWQQSALIRETENELQYAQARWLIRGAIDWAGVILREDARTSSLDHLGEPWAVPLADTR
ncbi:MAG TPA: type II secretion system minor pseudopilin GspK, partial [Burkholderiales bacterium]|nr:type II secretion system minor pseudopilin GspK [Burkholderiales bacterium]